MKSILEKFSGLTSLFRYSERLQPARDWFVLLAVCAVLLIGSVVWNAILFDRVVNGEAIGTASSTPSLAPTSIDSVVTLFQHRSEIETHYKNSHFVDPSVPGS